eukprot:SAG31_NODE_2418_length_5728_cov_4.291704_2_plen_217_part_00
MSVRTLRAGRVIYLLANSVTTIRYHNEAWLMQGFVGARLRNDRTGATVGFADFSVDEGASAAMAQLQGHKFDASQNEGLHLCRAKSSGSARSAQPLMNQSMFGAGAATTSTILSNTSMITHPYLSGHRVRPVTLYVEGVPDDATLREVKHLFRPFPTFKSLRLRKPEGPQRKKTLCFVEFGNEYDARQAMQVLNGYCFQDDDPSSGRLMIAFAKSN